MNTATIIPVINPEHYWGLSETVYQDETGLPVPINVHLSAQFLSKVPVISVRMSPDWNNNCDWTPVTICDKPVDIHNKLSINIFEKVVQYIILNKEKLIKYWYYIPNINARDYFEKINESS